MNKDKKTKVIFSMRIAAKLMEMEHKVLEILPNPKEPKYKMWVFEVDDTFDEDLSRLRGRG